MPGAIATTRIPCCARSRAAVTVIPATPAFDAAYATWPTWASNAAIDAVFTITPRCPSASAGSRLIASAASRSTLNVPTRLTPTTVRNSSRSCGPRRDTMRADGAMPAQLTASRSCCPSSSMRASAARTPASSVTSAASSVTPSGAVAPATARPGPARRRWRRARRARRRWPRPSPDAAPVTSAAEPAISMTLRTASGVAADGAHGPRRPGRRRSHGRDGAPGTAGRGWRRDTSAAGPVPLLFSRCRPSRR